MPKRSKGQKVEGLDDGKWYPATIGLRHKDGTYRLDWQGRWKGTFTTHVPDDNIQTRKSGRDVGLDELKGRDVAGVYILNVPKAEKDYYKIGISEADLEKRVSSYITAYPWAFNVVAIMVYDFRIDDMQRYLKVRDAETEILKAFGPDQMVKNHPNMKSSEWVVLNSAAQIKKLRDNMEEVAKKDGVVVSWFGDDHTIFLAGPQRWYKEWQEKELVPYIANAHHLLCSPAAVCPL